ncbi:MAG: Eco57I restriction-modification methylase domain-containing protein [Caldilineales bacterium]
MLAQSASAKAELGQFMTPAPVADFMASMFAPTRADVIRLLDPGAGVGSLTAAFVQRMCLQAPRPRRIEITVCDVDESLRSLLDETLRDCARTAAAHGIEVTTDLQTVDFIERFTDQVAGGLFSEPVSYTHIIANPPYKKIGSQSFHRRLLRSVGIEVTNLYAGFVALAIKLLAADGELVAITPRSFCNGPYFLPFRRLLFDDMAIHSIHTFGARDIAFKDDDVLQENIIIYAAKTKQPANIRLSASHGMDFDEIDQRQAPLSEVFQRDDPNLFIHIPISEADAANVRRMKTLRHSLDSLGISVSTGQIVEFRQKQHIHQVPEVGTAPLIYPAHFEDGFVHWPKLNARKPNAIEVNDETRRWLMPQGSYTLTRRFSSKEERRRIFAAVYEPAKVAAEWVGFENHLNVFHTEGAGLSPTTVRGLAIYLNSTPVDQFFRLFNGHTQVNATDLRVLPFPSRQTLDFLGAQLNSDRMPDQEDIDALVEDIVFDDPLLTT